jgi:hypothetical protein
VRFEETREGQWVWAGAADRELVGRL